MRNRIIHKEIDDDRNKIAHILGEISIFENEEGRPLLSPIVILAGYVYAGEGFFNLARELGYHHGNKEFEDLDYFVQEVKKVHGYWKSH